MFELLTCVPALLETYEGNDESGVTIRRYVILQPDLEVIAEDTDANYNQVSLDINNNQQLQSDPSSIKNQSDGFQLDLLNDELLMLAQWLVRKYQAEIIVFHVKQEEQYGLNYFLSVQPTDPSWPSLKIPDGIRVQGSVLADDQTQAQIIKEHNNSISLPLVNVLNKALERYSNQQHHHHNTLKNMLKFIENYAGQFYCMVQELEEEEASDDESEEGGSDGYDHSDDYDTASEHADELVNQSVEGQLNKFSVQMQNLKLDNVDTVQALQIRLQVGCDRCGQAWQINLNSSAVASSLGGSSSKSNSNSVEVSGECDHCHRPCVSKFWFKLIHEYNNEIGVMSCVGCYPVDWLPSMVAIQCTECGQQVVLRETQVGKPAFKDCKCCGKKCEVQFQSVLFCAVKDQRKKRSNKGKSGGKQTARCSKKAPQFNGVLKLGEPLPATGTCKHYQHSHKWYRFPCCGQRFPCDLCHEENTDGHEMRWANRLVCGFCSMEQSLTKTCVSCNKKLATGSGNPRGRNTRFWEGGKGCRDPKRMTGKDPRKYRNSKFKTRSKKQSRVGQEGAVRRERTSSAVHNNQDE
eukprot:TRINITY_DN6431_c1_g2_i1.p1 TRINITY_DN6431_c1_g2~~TRINITY_DN6431_c1_g2_i1.p1  ORF type:complete len:637 (+),score=93.70 TRINITY_DN6431_c1_g2_i1:181-1911(+)